jgi:hypothetical protein
MSTKRGLVLIEALAFVVHMYAGLRSRERVCLYKSTVSIYTAISSRVSMLPAS